MDGRLGRRRNGKPLEAAAAAESPDRPPLRAPGREATGSTGMAALGE